jgi:hypothetical protein
MPTFENVFLRIFFLAKFSKVERGKRTFSKGGRKNRTFSKEKTRTFSKVARPLLRIPPLSQTKS